MSPPKAKKPEIPFPIPAEPNGFYVGTSGWAYDIWQPNFFPEGLSKTKFLSYYATRLTACEVNYTFRNRLKETTALKWISETPPSFRFVCKANQYLTHMRRLKECEEPIRTFADGMAPLFNAHKFGAALFQLPPNLKADAVLLREFLALLPKWMHVAFEFRHESWLTDDIYMALSDVNAALCIAESEDFSVPEVHTASFAYYRFRKPDYSAADRQQLAERVKASRGKAAETYVFFKHDERPDSPLYAAELLDAVLR